MLDWWTTVRQHGLAQTPRCASCRANRAQVVKGGGHTSSALILNTEPPSCVCSQCPGVQHWPHATSVKSQDQTLYVYHSILSLQPQRRELTLLLLCAANSLPLSPFTSSLSTSASVCLSFFLHPHKLYFLFSFAGHLPHSLYGSHGFASASQEPKKPIKNMKKHTVDSWSFFN